jgi:hypothetical protein
VKRSADRAAKRNNLKQISIGLQAFHDTYDGFPLAVRKDKAGRPLSSWRLQILPFLESMMRKIEYGEAWNSPANRFLNELPFRNYCWLYKNDSPEKFHTNVVAVTGPGTPFGDDLQHSLRDIPLSTILVVEIAHSGIHWMAPGDLSLDSIPESIAYGLDGDGFHVVFADGQIWLLSPDVPLGDVKKFFTIDGARKHDREQLLGRYAINRSPP